MSILSNGRIRSAGDNKTFEVYEASNKRGGIQWNPTNDVCNIFAVGGAITLQTDSTNRLQITEEGLMQLNSANASTNQAVYQQTLTVHKGLSAAGTVVPIAFVDHTHALDIKVTIKQNTSNVATGIGHSVCAYGTANTGMTTVSGAGNVSGITLAYLNTNPSGQDYVLTLTWAGSGASPDAYVTIEGTSTGVLAEY